MRMNTKVIVSIIAFFIALAILGGGTVYLLTRGTPKEVVNTPLTTPTVQTSVQPVLSAQAILDSFAVGQAGAIDVFIDTKGEKVDGFQFIATLTGSALPTVKDANEAIDGVQIHTQEVAQLTVTTNSVVDQDGSKVIRFAMITQAGVENFSTSVPTKVATIYVTPKQSGSLSLMFNTQNSRASVVGGQDVLLATTNESYSVSEPLTQAASGSSKLATLVSKPQTGAVLAATTTYPTCQTTCVTDNDCDSGLSCQSGVCVNPSCSSSTSCTCGSSDEEEDASASATTQETEDLETEDTSDEELPLAGSIEYTMILVASGILFLGLGMVISTKA